ncbi:MAG: hypothetical protein NVS9B15_21510 [Acidobacteriaceae bacterium]
MRYSSSSGQFKSGSTLFKGERPKGGTMATKKAAKKATKKAAPKKKK